MEKLKYKFFLFFFAAYFCIPAGATEVKKLTDIKTTNKLKTKHKPKIILKTPIQIAQSIQKKYDIIKTAKLNFEQVYSHPITALQKSLGIVYFQKPGKMRWSYTKPTKKEFYINKNQLTYKAPDNQVFQNNCFKQTSMSASVAFLGGTGKLTDAFLIKKPDIKKLDPNYDWIMLIAKQKDAPAKKIFLAADKKSSEITESIVIDIANGKNHFKFTKRVINSKLANSTFVFSPPPGVNIQPMPNANCPSPKPAPKALTRSTKPATNPQKPIPIIKTKNINIKTKNTNTKPSKPTQKQQVLPK